MNREILFRAKVADEPDEWVFGYLINDSMIYQQNQTRLSKVCGNGSFSISKETIGQYINFKDKNGMKIFEGDIVIADKRKGIVVFKNNSFLIQYKKHESDKEYSYKAFDWFESHDIEIIGNVYEKSNDVK